MRVSDFDYDLPEELIAQSPCEPRDHSRLLVLGRDSGSLTHSRFFELKQWLRPGDALIFNDTRVIPARLIGHRAGTGGRIEVFLLNRQSGDVWETLVKPGRKARPGTTVEFGPELRCEILDTTDFGGRLVRFHYQGVFENVLDQLGETPLPPYIKAPLADRERYQTVYARERGSAAAPTAGLHFTQPLLEDIRGMGVDTAFVTLHVGLGTFRPVTADEVTDHVMHREYYSLPAETVEVIRRTKERGGRVIAVGTTTVRTLETAGSSGELAPVSGWTDIFLYPGCQFRVIDGLITNFHLPKSTLLMLVSAFAGQEKVLAAYREAVAQRYRFFSFGDAMLIL